MMTSLHLADHIPVAAHSLSADDVATALGVDPAIGLTAEEAATRLAAHGPNELEARRPPSLLTLLWDAVSEPFVVLLLAAGLLAIVLGEVRDGLLVLLGLAPIVGADLITSYRGERALEALRDSAAPMAATRRAGRVDQVRAATLVPGDVVLLAVGDVVPADVRLTRTDALLLDRSVLTGESVPEAGRVEPDSSEAALVDQRAVAFAGTRVVQGRGEGIVVATGPRSQLGRIASSLGGEERRRSPVQRELDRLVRMLLLVAIALIVITAGLALVRGEAVGVALLAGIAAAIAAIPEEPPVLLAVILGLGAYRLLKRGVLVRRLNAQETLAAVDLIVTDKTGTLTRNEVSLDAAFSPEGEIDGAALERVAQLALRAQDDAWVRARGGRAGSFTRSLERFLTAAGIELNLDPDDLVECEPAGVAHSYTRTLAQLPDGTRQELLLGAPEAVLATLGEARDLSSWHDLVKRQAEAGRRLLLLTERTDSVPAAPVALFSFSDPLRDDVGAALATATEAGIQTVIVTGDHPLTAGRIAAAAGLPAGTAVTGEELARWSHERLLAELPGLRLVARALPEQKLRLVEAARRSGRTVAVTGDGVNDAPALEHADVAVAMGSGAAVAREASDLVLGDDSFATLMNGLAEGRRMVANIQKGLVFLISTHVALLGFVLIATLYGFSQPLLPIHILWLEFFIDVSTSIAFEREPAERDLMRRPPRPRNKPLLDAGLLGRLAVAGSWTAIGALAIIATHEGGLDHARWVAFNALVAGQVVRAYANHSLTMPLLTLRRNGTLLVACFVGFVALIAIPHVPALADMFRAQPLDLGDWLLVALVALPPVLLAELMRGWGRRLWVA
jgi:Ca2+-transporting ATPase